MLTFTELRNKTVKKQPSAGAPRPLSDLFSPRSGPLRRPATAATNATQFHNNWGFGVSGGEAELPDGEGGSTEETKRRREGRLSNQRCPIGWLNRPQTASANPLSNLARATLRQTAPISAIPNGQKKHDSRGFCPES